MATSSLLWLPTTVPLHRSAPSRRGHHVPASSPHTRRLTCHAMKDLLGDFGARDPYPAEIASNFGDKVIGFSDTEHKILIPNLSALSLSQLPCERSPQALPLDDVQRLMKKVVGWRLMEAEGSSRLECVWKVRDYGSGVELMGRICKAAEEAGHYPDLHLEQPNMVSAALRTHSIGCLSINDFIVASKIDQIKVLDLIPKKRIWA